MVSLSATYAKSIFTFFQVRFFGETDDEACGRLREEERQRGGGGVGNEQGEVRIIDSDRTRSSFSLIIKGNNKFVNN